MSDSLFRVFVIPLGPHLGKTRNDERAKTRKRQLQNNSFDDKGRGVEIEQETDMETRRFQIRFHLSEVNVFERFHRFQLDNNLAFND